MSDDDPNDPAANVFAEQDITAQITDISPRPVKYGGMSDIYQATWNSPDGPIKVAVKVIRTYGEVNTGVLRRYRREIALWHSVKHPNILPLYGMCNGMSSLPAMVSPWCENGDINRYIKSHEGDANLHNLKLHLLEQVCYGLKHLHDEGIVHADLKGANVLISEDGVPRICDFGFSAILTAHSSSLSLHSSTLGGTYWWMERHLLAHAGARPRYLSDIWAFGCLVLEVQSGLAPYYDIESEQGVIVAIWNKEYPSCPNPTEFPNIVWKLILGCWTSVKQLLGFEDEALSLVDRLIQYVRIVRLAETIRTEADSLCVSLRKGASRADFLALQRDVQRCLTLIDELSDNAFTFKTANYRKIFLALFSFLQTTVLYAVRSSEKDAILTRIAEAVGPYLHLCSLTGGERLPVSDVRPIAAPFGTSIGRTMMQAFSMPGRTRTIDLHLPVDRHDSELLHLQVKDQSMFIISRSFKGPIAYIPGTHWIVLAIVARQLVVFDTRTGDAVCAFGGGDFDKCHPDDIVALAASPTGKMVASDWEKHSVQLWDAETGEAMGQPVRAHDATISSLAFSPDGAFLASGAENCSLRLCNLTTGDVLTDAIDTSHERSGDATYVAFSRDGALLVAFTRSGWGHVYSVLTGKLTLLLVLKARIGVYAVTFTADGRRVLVASHSGSICSFDIATQQEHFVPSRRGRLDPVPAYPAPVVFSPNGALLAAGSPLFYMQYTETGECLTLEGWLGTIQSDPFDSRPEAIAFSSDGTQVACSSGCAVDFWDCTDDWLVVERQISIL